jgi:Lrp/AsnC family leucine-responsive transcriptional regulator
MPPRIIDRIDLEILRELQRDARLSNVELAERINLSPSPCLARVRSLEQMGVINRYVALVDPRAVGLGLSVFVQVRLERQVEETLEQFENAVVRFAEVVECYLMSGDSDYLLRVVVSDVKALKEFILNGLTRLPGVANIRSSFALKQVKYDTALPLPDRIGTNSEKNARGRSGGRPKHGNRRN